MTESIKPTYKCPLQDVHMKDPTVILTYVGPRCPQSTQKRF